MMDFEQKAYVDTASWLQKPQTASVASDPAWRNAELQSSLIYAKALKDEIARVNKLAPGAREGAFKDFLVGTSPTNTIRKALRNKKVPGTDPTGDAEPMLPQHNKITDLY
jgi:hypothetical protein